MNRNPLCSIFIIQMKGVVNIASLTFGLHILVFNDIF